MDIENRQRTDISPYERGVSYSRWLRSGYFRSQDDIALALKISSSQVSRLIKMARLPAVIVDAFRSPVDICEGWGLELIEALEDMQRRQRILSKARMMTSLVPRPPGRVVFQRLISASPRGPKVKPRTHDEVVKDESGKPLFRIRQQSASIAVVLPLDRTSARALMNIRTAVSHILQYGEPVPFGVQQVPHALPACQVSLKECEHV